jgi:hypothetical protein
MTNQIIFLFMVLTLNACAPTPATEQQKKDKMTSAYFDQNIFKNIDKYENLKTFLENNIDTIIKFRYSKNTATLVRGQGQADSNYLADDNCYNFFQGNDRYDITNVPDNLKSELDSLFHTFNENELNSFGVCKDNKISIEIRSEGGDNGLYISHTLLWNTNMERDYAYDDNKDTLINGNCIYRIGLTEHHGH